MLTRSCSDSARQISVAVEMFCLLNFSMCLFTINVVLCREVWRKEIFLDKTYEVERDFRSIDGFHGVWLHFQRASGGVCDWYSCVQVTGKPVIK